MTAPKLRVTPLTVMSAVAGASGEATSVVMGTSWGTVPVAASIRPAPHPPHTRATPAPRYTTRDRYSFVTIVFIQDSTTAAPP
ncbi:hypothetical protein GCM10009670_20410 [Citricoccus alkalitolerans]